MKAIFTFFIVVLALKAEAQSNIDTNAKSIYIIESCAGLNTEVIVCPMAVYYEPLVGSKPVNMSLDRSSIETLPYTEIRDIVALSPEVYQRQRGADIHISGSRRESDMLYVIDGMRIAPN